MFFWDKTPCNVVDINGMIFGKKGMIFGKRYWTTKMCFLFILSTNRLKQNFIFF